jgi:hypothetical protein
MKQKKITATIPFSHFTVAETRNDNYLDGGKSSVSVTCVDGV